MSQYPQQPQYGGQDMYAEGYQPPPRTSGLAISALICALIFCVPLITPVLGLILGLAAIATIRSSNGAKSGTGIAISAVVLSLIVLGGQLFVGNFLWQAGRSWMAMIVELQDAPAEFLTEVEQGNFTSARTYLSEPLERSVTDEELAEFADQLQARFGAFRYWTFDPESMDNFDPSRSRTSTVEGEFVFANGTYPGSVQIFIDFDQTNGQVLDWGIEEISIETPEGDVVFPQPSLAPAPPATGAGEVEEPNSGGG